jgi:hypothetical protein
MTLRPDLGRRKGAGGVLASLRSESGFGLIESVMAMTLLLVVAASLGGLLTSSITAHKLSRERSLAEQAVLAQIERIRATAYSNVGTVGGNPPGVFNASQPITLPGGNSTLAIRIQYVNDPTPTSYNQLANYKRVTVTVTRNSDSKELAREVTFVAPAARDPYSGINQAGIAATVIDMGDNTPLENVAVALGTGPSAPRSDTTDETGTVTFAGLTENPTSGTQQYADLTVTAPSGYNVLPDDVSPAAAAHVNLAPGQTFNTALRVYKPSTITVNITNGGSAYTGAVTLTVTSQRGGQTFTNTYTATGGTYTISNVIPDPEGYTISATTASGLEADPVTQAVPNDYPSDLTSTFNLDLYRPTGTVNVTATALGVPASGATITLSGGPNSINVSATANSSGVAQFLNVPNGAGYTATAVLGGNSGTQTANVAPRTTTNISVAIAVATGILKTVVSQNGFAVSGATVTITGGPYSSNVVGTTNSSGVYQATLPSGSGYNVVASGGPGPDSASQSGLTVNTGATTVLNLALPLPTVIKVIAQRRSSGNCVADSSGSQRASISLKNSAGTTTLFGPFNGDTTGMYQFYGVTGGTTYLASATYNGNTGTKSVTATAGATVTVIVTTSGTPAC